MLKILDQEKSSDVSSAIFLNKTQIAGVNKIRYECPFCGTRFNLIKRNFDQLHICKGCKQYVRVLK